jgi:flavin reductase (DIM6/NTAB) family NADH-FMN oxidoreductase RutF
MAYLESPAENSRAALASAARGAATPGPAHEFESAAYRHAMRELASGVALVTTGAGEARAGCTATALCSLSLDPPSLIVSISRASATLARLRANGVFGVSILAAAHEDLANRFAGRGGIHGAARFAGANWIALATGSPLLEDALALIDCAVEDILERHTHAIVIGEVKAVRRNTGAPALLHWRGQYQRLE